MTALLRAEFLKLRTTRTFAVLVGTAVVLSLIVVALTTVLTDGFDESQVREAFASDFTGLFIILLGVMGMAGEWRHQTITGTILSAPRRVRLLAAKALSYAAAGIVLSIAVSASIIAVGTLILDLRGETVLGAGDMLDVLWRNVIIAGMFGAIGVCVGGLVRNQVVAIVGLLILGFAVEPAVQSLAPDIGQYGPIGGGPNAILGIDAFDTGSLLPLGTGLLVMAGWISVLFAAAAVELRRRDLT